MIYFLLILGFICFFCNSYVAAAIAFGTATWMATRNLRKVLKGGTGLTITNPSKSPETAPQQLHGIRLFSNQECDSCGKEHKEGELMSWDQNANKTYCDNNFCSLPK